MIDSSYYLYGLIKHCPTFMYVKTNERRFESFYIHKIMADVRLLYISNINNSSLSNKTSKPIFTFHHR